MYLEFKKYIISIDYGGSAIKYLVMDTSSDDFKIVEMDTNTIINANEFIAYIVNKLNISEDDIEVLLITGARSSFINKDVNYKFKIITVSEFVSASYGSLLLTKLDRALVVNLGTGTTFIYSDLLNVEHLGGTALGGGTIMSLSKLLYNITDYDEMISFINKGNTNNVDLNISDISKNKIGDLNLDITASNLGAVINNAKKYNDNDVLSGIVNMVFQNIGLLIKEHKKNIESKYSIKNLPVILFGGVLKNSNIYKYFENIEKYTNIKYIYPKYSSHVVCIGAYEYYVLKLKNEH